MPQMKPAKWTLILYLTSFSILITMSSLYFMNNPSITLPKTSSSSSKSSLWVWKW